MTRNAWLVLHILGVVIFLGNIIVTAVWKVLADRTRNPAVVGYAQRLVTLTDIAFTATGATLITVSGLALADRFGGVGGPGWLTLGFALFITSGVIWVTTLIPIQVLQSRLARRVSSRRSRDSPVPSRARILSGAAIARLRYLPAPRPARAYGRLSGLRRSSGMATELGSGK